MGNTLCPGQCNPRRRNNPSSRTPDRPTSNSNVSQQIHPSVSSSNNNNNNNNNNINNSHNLNDPTNTNTVVVHHSTSNSLVIPVPLTISNTDVMVYVSPGVKRPLSQLTEEEQVQICIRLGLIDSFPQSIYDDTKREKFTECAICMDDYLEGEKLRVLPCLHAFHRECIDDWLQRSFTCPSCQQDLLQQLSAQSPSSALSMEKYLTNTEHQQQQQLHNHNNPRRDNIILIPESSVNHNNNLRLIRRASGHPIRQQQRSIRRSSSSHIGRSKSFTSLPVTLPQSSLPPNHSPATNIALQTIILHPQQQQQPGQITLSSFSSVYSPPPPPQSSHHHAVIPVMEQPTSSSSTQAF